MIKIRLNENSSREEILKWIEIYLFEFLYNFSDKPWAQPYLDKAAKNAAREESFYFLYNLSDKPWAQPYIDEAAKIAIEKDSIDFLSDFSDEPWAQPYIDDAVSEAVKENPKLFLEEFADRFPQGINWALFALGSENVYK